MTFATHAWHVTPDFDPAPLRYRKRGRVMVTAGQGDLFGSDVPDESITKAMAHDNPHSRPGRDRSGEKHEQAY